MQPLKTLIKTIWTYPTPQKTALKFKKENNNNNLTIFYFQKTLWFLPPIA